MGFLGAGGVNAGCNSLARITTESHAEPLYLYRFRRYRGPADPLEAVLATFRQHVAGGLTLEKAEELACDFIAKLSQA